MRKATARMGGVEATADFAPLLERCFKEGGVHLVEVPVDYSENQWLLIDELAAKVDSILGLIRRRHKIRTYQP